ncbi:MAG: MotA/TolQ/ExbB proton channel family protein [Verrucomicrobia bacterium]|nr:MotA/TolQ/ExbB proton channel family protein [Verrucomicrobiota bacterium]
MISSFLLKSNPFLDAYIDSDLLGKSIFVSLVVLSLISWSILLYKLWLTRKVKNGSLSFRKLFFEKRSSPLSIDHTPGDYPNAFGIIHEVLKDKSLQILERNQSGSATHLSSADIALLETHGSTAIASLTKYLENHLYILSTIVTLAPFLGLLGTVYGILVTFTQMQTDPGSGANQAILGGLSLALTTTVLGLVDAIPALIGYNYLKNVVHNFETDMERFATDILSSIELQYRPVEQ